MWFPGVAQEQMPSNQTDTKASKLGRASNLEEAKELLKKMDELRDQWLKAS
jgi:hypothetical protein